MINISMLIILIAFLIYLIPTIAIHKNLNRYSDKSPAFFYMQIHMGKYLKQYRKITKLKKGRTGAYYIIWYFGLGMALLLVVTAVLILVLIK
ncbi:MAG: hypothetical protein JXR21_04425 [Candidatus Marinimicrobia bacterium]|nr:hypothetical protein [Candidatus Neomarinimicrobiota bacterium]